MALTAHVLGDTSAAARLNHPMVKQLVGPMIESGVVATTAALDYEAFSSARSPAEFARMRDHRKLAYEYLSTNDEHWQRALDAQFRLARSGRHESEAIVSERNSRVAEALVAAGIETRIRILDADAKTAVAAAEQLGCEVGAIANSVVFDCDGEPLLVMASGAHRVDTHLLAEVVGATTIGKASPRMVRESTGQIIGGVAPVGHPRLLRTIVDESLAEHPVVWTAAGTADSVLPLTYAQLLTLTEGVAAQVR